MEFQVQYLFLFHLFSQMHGFTYFRMESLSKSIQLILEFLKAPFLVLFYSTSLKIFYARLLFLLMIIPSTLSMRKYLICVNNQSWLLGLNLTYETVDCGKKWLVNLRAGKTQFASFDWSSSSCAFDVKMEETVLQEKSFSF